MDDKGVINWNPISLIVRSNKSPTTSIYVGYWTAPRLLKKKYTPYTHLYINNNYDRNAESFIHLKSPSYQLCVQQLLGQRKE